MSYLLDANVFIAAKNLHYGLDFCPAFWDWLSHKGNTGSVFSIDKVADEIEAGQDELTDWARDHGQALFRRTPPALAPQFTQVRHMGNRAALHAGGHQHLFAGRRLLSDCPCAGRQPCRDNPRASVQLAKPHQDTRCLPGPGRAVHDALPDAAHRTGPLRAGSARMSGLTAFEENWAWPKST